MKLLISDATLKRLHSPYNLIIHRRRHLSLLLRAALNEMHT